MFQDTSETCQLLIEGAWYAHTGYGLAFPRNSKYLPQFNKYLMEYKENGDLERLRRFYFTGPCSIERGNLQSQPTSIGKFNTFGTGPLALEQFLSVFLLLGIGVCVACVFVLLEKAYANCIVKQVFGNGEGFKKSQQSLDNAEHKSKKAPPACLQLLSQVIFNISSVKCDCHNCKNFLNSFIFYLCNRIWDYHTLEHFIRHTSVTLRSDYWIILRRHLTCTIIHITRLRTIIMDFWSHLSYGR